MLFLYLAGDGMKDNITISRTKLRHLLGDFLMFCKQQKTIDDFKIKEWIRKNFPEEYMMKWEFDNEEIKEFLVDFLRYLHDNRMCSFELSQLYGRQVELSKEYMNFVRDK
jgi:hypothetical protein